MGLAPLERNAVSAPARSASDSTRRRPVASAAWSATLRAACLALVLLALMGALPSAGQAPPVVPGSDPATVILVVGAAGEAEFGTNFLQQVSLWEKACQQASARLVTLGLDGGTNDHERLAQTLEAEPKTGGADLWLVLIGHGTFDNQDAKFNLRGPDLPATELATWLQPFQRPVAVIDTSACSAPFLNKLSATNRVVVTATRSGHEQSYARFGPFFAAALTDPQSDLDQDGQTSLLEAFLSAAHRVLEFYQTEARLATEHALIDDNADGLGTPAEWFRGVRATQRAKDGTSLDGLRAHQRHLIRSREEQTLTAETRAKRDALELAVARLRDRKAELPGDDYYRQLEALLLELARLANAKR